MNVYLELVTEFGTYTCEVLEVDEDQFLKLKDYVKSYHLESFEAFLQDGSYMVVPQSTLYRSQLFIRILE